MAYPIPERSAFASPPQFTPKTAIDPCSTVAFYALFTVLDEKDRFGIIGNKVEYQPTTPINLPYFGQTDLQSLSRTYNRNSREEACDFVHAITEALVSHLKDPAFQKVLPQLAKGLLRYVVSYGENDNATTTFTLGADRVQEAILNIKTPDIFINKHRQEYSPEMASLKERISSNWTSGDISFLAHGIFNAQAKIEDRQNCKAYLEPLIKFISLKQDEVSLELQSLQSLQAKK